MPIARALSIFADMPRGACDSLGGYCYHVFNRGDARRTVFRKGGDYDAFVRLLREAGERVDVRLVAFACRGIISSSALAALGWRPERKEVDVGPVGSLSG